MGEHVFKLPDVGEGVAEAELVEWHVKIGDLVREDALLAAVMTDKATVEIPSPVEGEIVWLGAKVGDLIAVGSDLLRHKGRAGPAEREGSRRRNRKIRSTG
jgi:2-oxoisovalerate dehydrogenase E2 component (dihydrolipoyl transacylase)